MPGMRTQVAIVGAGPAGLLLSHLLARQGVESVIVERRSREHVESRIRAGVIEHGAVDTLVEAGLGERLTREGMRHDGIYLQIPGERHRIDFQDLVGRSVWVYGQTELTKDLIENRLAAGQPIHWEATDAAIHDVTGSSPSVTFTDAAGASHRVTCDFVAGCDGFHGTSRQTIPREARTVHERVYPYSWLGILAQVAPSTDELIYAWHPDGFALHSMRSDAVSRLYLQVPADDDVTNWSDSRIWDELGNRFVLDGWELRRGPLLEKSITPMRSFVSSPMRFGRLLLAGDASHIVPPAGAKGLNLAIADVRRLAEALGCYFVGGSEGLLDAYSDAALQRVWRATHFSWWMTNMLHSPLGADADAAFTRQLQLAQLRYVMTSENAAAGLAENYTGMVMDGLPWGS